MMRKTLFTMMCAAGMVAGAFAQNDSREAAVDAAAAAAENALKSKDLAKLLKGQLIVADGEKTKAAEFEEGMEFYLVYHSASW